MESLSHNIIKQRLPPKAAGAFRIEVQMKKSVIIFIIVLSLIFIFGVIGWVVLTAAPTDAPVAYIYSDGDLIRTAKLSQEAEFTVRYGDGYNTIKVIDGAIFVTDASCPDGVCISTGKISHGAVPIICMPNHLEIIVKSSDDTTDAVIS